MSYARTLVAIWFDYPLWSNHPPRDSRAKAGVEGDEGDGPPPYLLDAPLEYMPAHSSADMSLISEKICTVRCSQHYIRMTGGNMHKVCYKLMIITAKNLLERVTSYDFNDKVAKCLDPRTSLIRCNGAIEPGYGYMSMSDLKRTYNSHTAYRNVIAARFMQEHKERAERIMSTVPSESLDIMTGRLFTCHSGDKTKMSKDIMCAHLDCTTIINSATTKCNGCRHGWF